MSTRLPLPGIYHPTCGLFPNVRPLFFIMKPLATDNQPCGAALPHQPDLFLTALATNPPRSVGAKKRVFPEALTQSALAGGGTFFCR